VGKLPLDKILPICEANKEVLRARKPAAEGQRKESHQEETMPYVNIRITREGATAEQKAALIKGATQLLVDILGKNPATTVVVIDEVETDNWGIGGESITVRRQQGK
jgi:4-oxalocrotonate tautomerase